MPTILRVVIILFTMLSACVPVSPGKSTPTQTVGTQFPMQTVTSFPTATQVSIFSATPTFSPFPTLSDDYYSTPSQFRLVYIKMFDERNGWGWVTNYDGILYRPVRTYDGGKSWMDVSPIERFGVTHHFFLDEKTAWISDLKWSQTTEWRSLYFTKNGGISWEIVSVPPAGILWLYFVDASNGWFQSASDTLYQTMDSGRVWKKFLDNSPVGANKFLFRDTTNIWTGRSGPANPGFQYFDVSWDGGKTWETKDMPFRHEKFLDTDLEIVNLPVFFGEQLGYVTAQYTRWEAERAERLLAVFITNDGGHTWTQQSTVAQNFRATNAIDFVSPEIAFTACREGLCMTQDGAKTWQVIQLDETQRDLFDGVDSIDIDFVTDLKGWLLTWKIGVGTDLYLTEDGGRTWLPLPIEIYRNQ